MGELPDLKNWTIATFDGLSDDKQSVKICWT